MPIWTSVPDVVTPTAESAAEASLRERSESLHRNGWILGGSKTMSSKFKSVAQVGGALAPVTAMGAPPAPPRGRRKA